ncbi:MAG: hypothetical protein U0M72_05650 [Eggerthellaceae bacterium]
MNVVILAGGHVADEARNAASRKETEAMAAALTKGEHQVDVIDASQNVVVSLQTHRPDICIIAPDACGADGALQGMLDLLQVPHVGSGSQTCRIVRAKDAVPFVAARCGDASGDELSFEPLASFVVSQALYQANGSALVAALEQRVPGGYPMEVCSEMEPSVLVSTEDELSNALSRATARGTALVRQWVEGVALSVCVLGTGWDAHVLPPVEVVRQDADATASSDGSATAAAFLPGYDLFAPVRQESLSSDKGVAQAIRSEIERVAFDVCLALGARDCAVVELIWDGAQVRFVDIDCVPEMSEGSVFSEACKAAGLSIEGVLDRLVSL